LQFRAQGLDADLEADLVVALAGAAVGDGGGAELLGGGDQVLDDDRAGDRRDQRVVVLVEGPGLQGGHAVLVGELVAGIGHVGLDGPAAQGAVAHGFQGFPALSDVDRHGDDLGAGGFADPADGHGRIQAAGVGQDNAFLHGVLLCEWGPALLRARHIRFLFTSLHNYATYAIRPPRPGRLAVMNEPAEQPAVQPGDQPADQPTPELTDEELAFLHSTFDLARQGEAAKLLALIEQGLPADLTDHKGDTLLILASYNGHNDLARALVERGATVDRLNDKGQSALTCAVFRQNAELTRFLLEAG